MTRVGTNVKKDLREKGNLQFIWQGHSEDSSIWAHVN